MRWGFNRELDYGRFLNSWPVGGLELAQLLEAVRGCESFQPRLLLKTSLGLLGLGFLAFTLVLERFWA